MAISDLQARCLTPSTPFWLKLPQRPPSAPSGTSGAHCRRGAASWPVCGWPGRRTSREASLAPSGWPAPGGGPRGPERRALASRTPRGFLQPRRVLEARARRSRSLGPPLVHPQRVQFVPAAAEPVPQGRQRRFLAGRRCAAWPPPRGQPPHGSQRIELSDPWWCCLRLFLLLLRQKLPLLISLCLCATAAAVAVPHQPGGFGQGQRGVGCSRQSGGTKRTWSPDRETEWASSWLHRERSWSQAPPGLAAGPCCLLCAPPHEQPEEGTQEDQEVGQ